MKISCMIIDDEPIACRGMREYVEQVDFLDLKAVVGDALQAYRVLNEEPIDLIFLDIEMPRLSGIDFIRSLKTVPFIIFTTAYPRYALQGYDLDVVDYLVKPIPFPRFLKAVNKVRDLLISKQAVKTGITENRDHFFLKENGKFTRIFYADVLFAEALQNYVAIHLKGKKLLGYITLSILEEQLPSALFMKVHKSYLVSLDKIDAIEGNELLIQSVRIPISRNLKETLMKKVLENKLLKR
jgi:DNA-binding LytR/AlgR family response regulator